VRDEPDLSPAGERWLGQWAREHHGSDWLFVTGYPMRKRPFYTHPDPERPEHSRSFDLLFRGTELVTGGQRLHRHAGYLAALEARGMTGEPIAAYLGAFRHGMPPHGGFAIRPRALPDAAARSAQHPPRGAVSPRSGTAIALTVGSIEPPHDRTTAVGHYQIRPRSCFADETRCFKVETADVAELCSDRSSANRGPVSVA
jgi:hypothetical protein